MGPLREPDTTFTPDNLVAGNFPIQTGGFTLIAGQNLSRGTPLGIISASGKLTQSASAAGNGSEKVRAILAEDCDASGGDAACVVYLSGEFNEDDVEALLGAGHTLASVKQDLAENGIPIYLRQVL